MRGEYNKKEEDEKAVQSEATDSKQIKVYLSSLSVYILKTYMCVCMYLAWK